MLANFITKVSLAVLVVNTLHSTYSITGMKTNMCLGYVCRQQSKNTHTKKDKSEKTKTDKFNVWGKSIL